MDVDLTTPTGGVGGWGGVVVHGCVCVTRDISSRKRTMGRLKQREKEEFILLGIAQQAGEWAELSGSCQRGWRMRVARLCVFTGKCRR